MLSTAAMQNPKVTDLKQGRELVQELGRQISAIIKRMERANNNETWERLSDEKYALVQARRSVQNQTGKLVKERRNV